MPEDTHPQASAHFGALVLIDTHVVLDWFWFADPRVQPLADDVRAGTLRWLISPPMRAELERVLHRLPSIRQRNSREHVLTSIDRWSIPVVSVEWPAAPRVSDPDDQMFVDLALQSRAAGLLTRDRALLKLSRRLARDGCIVATPEAYAGGTAAARIKARSACGT